MDKKCLCGCGGMVKKDKRFIHGHNKGHTQPHTEESKRKIKQKQQEWHKTQDFQEFRKRQSTNSKSSKTLFKKGHEPYWEVVRFIRPFQNGSRHWNWRGGITPEVQRIRHCKKYRDWRKGVFEKDNYTCQICKKKGGYLEADHFPIKFYILFDRKDWKTMWDINNGRTLCRPCHDKTKQYSKERSL